MTVRDGKNYMNNEHNAKYAFYYLLSLAALIFMALSFGMILFGIIDKTIPDILRSYSPNSINSQFKFAISALFISAPIYYFMQHLISRGLRRGGLEKESAIRRWLTYFIILVSSLIILGSFVGMINNFLSGELTGRFILKALVVLLISGATFSFYFYDVKREAPEKSSIVVRIFFWATLSLVLAAFIAAFFFVESPKEARLRRLDEILVNRIYSLENAVNSYYDFNKMLPENLEALKDHSRSKFNESFLLDPESREAIVYQKITETEFEFCATFRTNSTKNQETNEYFDYNNKDHDSGYQCISGTLWSKPETVARDKELID